MPGYPGMTCREVMREITAYFEGALTPSDRERFEAHCGACPSCRIVLAEWQTMVGALGRLEDHEASAGDTDVARLVSLFRERGHHREGARNPSIPLGLAGKLASPGDHIVYFWETEEELVATAGFVAAGMEQGETSVVLCHDEAHDRLAAAIGAVGLDVEALRREDLLRFVSGAQSADALLEEVDEQVRSAVDLGAPLVRVLGVLGWRQRGSPEDDELLRLESLVTDAIRKLPVVVACTFEVGRIPGRILMQGGLECHPLVFRRNTLRHNELYVPAGREPHL
jgi:DcmR-like sensory protein/putative zinc finger protein